MTYELWKLTHQICFQLWSSKVCQSHSSKRFDGPFFSIGINELKHPLALKLLLVFSFFIVTNPYGDGLSFFSLLSLPQSHTPMSIVEKLFSGKCNMMLFCDHKMFNTSYWDFSNTLSRPDNAALWKIVWFYCRVWFFDYENFLNKKEIILPLIAESILVVSTMFYAWEA